MVLLCVAVTRAHCSAGFTRVVLHDIIAILLLCGGHSHDQANYINALAVSVSPWVDFFKHWVDFFMTLGELLKFVR
jgi:hypothetical protein